MSNFIVIKSQSHQIYAQHSFILELIYFPHPSGNLGVVPVLVLDVGDSTELDDLSHECSEVEESPEGGKPKLLHKKGGKLMLRFIPIMILFYVTLRLLLKGCVSTIPMLRIFSLLRLITVIAFLWV